MKNRETNMQQDLSEMTSHDIMSLLFNSAVDDTITMPIWMASQIINLDHIRDERLNDWAWMTIQSSFEE